RARRGGRRGGEEDLGRYRFYDRADVLDLVLVHGMAHSWIQLHGGHGAHALENLGRLGHPILSDVRIDVAAAEEHWSSVEVARKHDLGGDGHDVGCARPAPMGEDHGRARPVERFPRFEDGLTLMRTSHGRVSESNVLPDMTQPAGSFNYANPRAIHWGAGSLAQLAPELKRLQVMRVALITTRSLVAEATLLARVRDALGEAEAPATELVSQHAPM